MSHITFRENVIPVETKELRMALLKIQDLKSDWEEEEEKRRRRRIVIMTTILRQVPVVMMLNLWNC